ncbi:hypothetical protein [Nocardiopsis ansamitocini]|uniref:Uncharacterized protein n=1 Tax=Nocardiopsis ansamitocini TaxID=1670832 RepID=A0A9W6UGS2_9ACTN|nr:hypothetical protein [Nocardiopsis ansamitocini]GLU45739.1 hypothetical protein Nans01_00900 [Nocardiopsis ansamitocini]
MENVDWSDLDDEEMLAAAYALIDEEKPGSGLLALLDALASPQDSPKNGPPGH